jgi:putative Holliday junction resolvase
VTESKNSGRILGLDVGERRIGVAISDPDRRFALPLHSIDGRDQRAAIEAIGGLAREDEVDELVVGLPLSLSGESGTQAGKSTDFAQALEAQIGLPVHLWDERLSTQEAIRRVADERPQGRERRGRTQRRPEADTDALAASIILQAYLDRLRNA